MPLERLKATGAFLREFVEAVPGAVYAKDRQGRVLLGNTAFAEAVGWKAGDYVGKTDLELLTDQELALTIMQNDQRVMDGGRRCQLEETLLNRDGTVSHWLSTKVPVRDDQGEVAGLVGVSVNITERRRQEERERLLAREVEHRNKNLLGVVQSLARLTKAETVEDYRKALLQRLEALSRSQSVLVQRQQVDIRDILVEELGAYSADRARLQGPLVILRPDRAQALAIAFHELATNAAKYGAFASRGGSLEVTWEFHQAGKQVRISWEEKGGPTVMEPTQRGFGTRLLRSLVEHQLHGTLSTTWNPAGLRCTMELPVETDTP